MAIIKYSLVNRLKPSYITDGGYFYDSRDDTYIGIGSGGGTELTKAELVTRMQTFSTNPRSYTWDRLNNAGEDLASLGLRSTHHVDESTIRPFTDAAYEAQVNDWCTSKGL